MGDYSLLLITSGRDEHLRHTLAGAAAMTIPPGEAVVVFMNQPEHPEIDVDISITTLDLHSDHRLPLAEARNLAASAAKHDSLIFLDVDCIPSRDFARTLLADHERHRGLVMATPRYLPPDIGSYDEASLLRTSHVHPIRASLPIGPANNYALFWSLCFAIGAGDWARVGGFDITLNGYGGEDTDFAWSAEKAGVGFALSEAVAFHQHHDSHRPPLNHFTDIVANAQRLRHKWGRWAMEGWLDAFVSLGLIEWSVDGDDLTVLREPTAEEVAASRSAGVFA